MLFKSSISFKIFVVLIELVDYFFQNGKKFGFKCSRMFSSHTMKEQSNCSLSLKGKTDGSKKAKKVLTTKFQDFNSRSLRRFHPREELLDVLLHFKPMLHESNKL